MKATIEESKMGMQNKVWNDWKLRNKLVLPTQKNGTTKDVAHLYIGSMPKESVKQVEQKLKEVREGWN